MSVIAAKQTLSGRASTSIYDPISEIGKLTFAMNY
jgi:hypothetical protein